MRRPAGLPALALLGLLLPAARGDCSSPGHIEHAELRSGAIKDSYPVGTTLTYRCISGYELISGKLPRITCSDTSQWVPRNPRFCHGKKCPFPDLENGRIVSSTDMRLGDRITFACEKGYRLIGDKTARCTLKAGKVDWDYRPSCQRIPCFPPPPIDHGKISGDVSKEYAFGAAITYRCDPDYSLIGKKTLVCRVAADGKNGEWDSPPPECKVVQCPRPEIEHGSISAFMPSYPYDHSLVISCDAGYTLSGASLIKCGADNNWHPPVPTCLFGTTKSPDHNPASTLAPEKDPASAKPPKDEPGSNHAVGLGLGLGGTLVFTAVGVSVWWHDRTKGKMDSGTSPPGSYGIIPQNTDRVLEEKEPSQV